MQKLTHVYYFLVEYMFGSYSGINKGMYSEELMSNCQKIISDETAKITDPVQVLHRSVNETKSSGSSTALIAHLDNNVRLGP